MDDARADLLEKVWQAIIRRKRLLTAQIVENRAKIKVAKGADLIAALNANKEAQAQLCLLDEIVAEGSST